MVVSKSKPFKKSRKKENPDELWRVICCCLSADGATRQFFWKAMVKYTLLVNRLLEQVGQLPEFKQWQEKGTLSKEPVKKLCAALRKRHTEFQGLPSRFYTSATLIVAYTFES